MKLILFFLVVVSLLSATHLGNLLSSSQETPTPLTMATTEDLFANKPATEVDMNSAVYPEVTVEAIDQANLLSKHNAYKEENVRSHLSDVNDVQDVTPASVKVESSEYLGSIARLSADNAILTKEIIAKLNQ